MEAKQPKSEEFTRFTSLVDRVLSGPKAEIQKRQDEYKQVSKADPKKRGPKKKTL